jgi:hypothetical protein
VAFAAHLAGGGVFAVIAGVALGGLAASGWRQDRWLSSAAAERDAA